MSGAFRHAQRIGQVARDSKYIVLRGVPLSATGHDVRRMIQKADIKGVVDVSLYYKHFRPTGKVILTASLPDYSQNIIRGVRDIVLPGTEVKAENIHEIASMNIPENPADIGKEDAVDYTQVGTGPAARVPERRTVTISGVPGKRSVRDLEYLLKDFRLAEDRKYPVQVVPQPLKKFTMFSRFVVYLETESEAQRLVRVAHLTPYKNLPSAPLLRANVIY